MSFRDIEYILKKEGLSHGIVTVEKGRYDDNKKSHSNNEKSTQAYKLFSEGIKPIEGPYSWASLKGKQPDTIQNTGD